MPIAAAICLARQGRETEGRAVLAKCMTSRAYGTDTAADLWRVFDNELGADAAAPTPTTRRRPGVPGASSPLELTTAADLLADAATEYAGHGCNDYLVAASVANHNVIAAVIEFGNERVGHGAAIRHGARSGWRERVAAPGDAGTDGVVAAFTVDVLRWLAVRCREAVGRPPLPARRAAQLDQRKGALPSRDRTGRELDSRLREK